MPNQQQQSQQQAMNQSQDLQKINSGAATNPHKKGS